MVKSGRGAVGGGGVEAMNESEKERQLGTSRRVELPLYAQCVWWGPGAGAGVGVVVYT
jgi:hypothetical protein